MQVYSRSNKDFQNIIEDLIKEAHTLRFYDIKAILFIRKGLVQKDNLLIKKGLRILEILELNEVTVSVNKEIDIYQTHQL
ncbi:hypothetical protein GCM10022410_02010 [Amphibacillus indicireducens]|uniref:Uncharacterized protein n=1 Tax=Amphibacillus indicireducens TaxID=1076330 RepID=A0ABP7V311_9BACI